MFFLLFFYVVAIKDLFLLNKSVEKQVHLSVSSLHFCDN